MGLYHFHRVLISAAILFFFGFAVFAMRHHGVSESSRFLWMGIGSATAGVMLVGYLIYFNINLRGMRSRH